MTDLGRAYRESSALTSWSRALLRLQPSCPITDSVSAGPNRCSESVTFWRTYRAFYEHLLNLHPLSRFFRGVLRAVQAFAARVMTYLASKELKQTNEYQADYRLAWMAVKFAVSGRFPWGRLPAGMNPWDAAFCWMFGYWPEKLIPIWEEFRHRYDTVPTKPVKSVGRQIGKAAAVGK